MTVAAAFAIIVLLFNSFASMTTPPAGEVEVTAIGASGEVVFPPVHHEVRSYQDLQQNGIVKQSFDYSCGSAAFATLINRYLGENLSERQVIDGLLKYGDTDAIMLRQAFSMLDMKRFSIALGYRAGGFQGELSDLEELELPCIVPIRFSGYQHFVVLKAIAGGRAFLSDPFQGNLVMGTKEFEEMWVDNMLFLVNPKGGGNLSSPRLTEVDLRFVDSDFARNIANDYVPPYTAPEARSVYEALGTQQFYKPR